jgi:hypothetical protein
MIHPINATYTGPGDNAVAEAVNVQMTTRAGASYKFGPITVKRPAASFMFFSDEVAELEDGIKVGGIIEVTETGEQWEVVDPPQREGMYHGTGQFLVVETLMNAGNFVSGNAAGNTITLSRPVVHGRNEMLAIEGDDIPTEYQDLPAIVSQVSLRELTSLGIASVPSATRHFVIADIEPETTDIVIWNDNNWRIVYVEEVGANVYDIYAHEEVPR